MNVTEIRDTKAAQAAVDAGLIEGFTLHSDGRLATITFKPQIAELMSAADLSKSTQSAFDKAMGEEADKLLRAMRAHDAKKDT